jgi:hypothetical protein
MASSPRAIVAGLLRFYDQTIALKLGGARGPQMRTPIIGSVTDIGMYVRLKAEVTGMTTVSP